MRLFISYTEAAGGFFQPPDVPEEPNTWEHLCLVDGRHYAVLYHPIPDGQDARIDLQVHDPEAEPEVAELIRTFGHPYRRYREAREVEYPPIGEQLDTILKAFNQLRLNGTGLPKEMDELLGKWLAVKRAHPKPDLLEDEDAGSGA